MVPFYRDGNLSVYRLAQQEWMSLEVNEEAVRKRLQAALSLAFNDASPEFHIDNLELTVVRLGSKSWKATDEIVERALRACSPGAKIAFEEIEDFR